MSSVKNRPKETSGHPGDGEWLRFADGEVSAREEKSMRVHLTACWQCRATLEEIQRAVSDCVQYRQVVLQECYPAPPAPWFDIYREFNKLDEQAATRSWFARFTDWFSMAFWSQKRTSFAAIALTLVALVVWQTWQLPAVEASNLLRRAVATAENRPTTLRRVRIKTKHATMTRVIGTKLQATQNKDIEPIEALFRRAHYDWDDPLSARSFQNWRAKLASKHDEVTTMLGASDQRYHKIRTTTASGELVEASLTLRATDLEPMSSTLEFRNHESVEIEALPAEQTPAIGSTGVVPTETHPGPTVASPAAPEPATLYDELLVFKALRGIGADLDQPLEVTRTDETVQVTGVGVPPERQQQLHNVLDGLPRVKLQLSDVGGTSLTQPERHLSSSSTPTSPEIEQLQGRLEAAMGGRAAFTQVADRALESSDNLLARIHALRRLAERYPTQVEEQMTAKERAVLTGLRRDHATAVLAQAATLQKLLRPALRTVSATLDARPAMGLNLGSWQSATEQLFATGRQVDVLLAGTLAAAPATLPAASIPSELLARLADLMAQAEGYEKMAREVQ